MRRQKGFSLIELLIVVAIILIIAAIAIPSLLRSRIAANDSAAASTIRTLNTAQITYVSNYPKHGFAETLSDLGAGTGTLDCSVVANVKDTSACLVDTTVACAAPATGCKKGGYTYLEIKSSSTTQPVPDYVVAAAPTSFGTSGSQNWCSYMDGVVRTSRNATAAVTTSIAATPDMSGCNNAAAFGPAQ